MLNEKLQQIIDVLPIIKQLFEQDVFLPVMDGKAVVQGVEVPNGVQPKVFVGEVFQDSTGVLYEVLKTGKSKHNYLPKEVVGEALEGILVPVKDSGEVVGCVVCTYSVDKREQMAQITNKFQESVNNVTDSIRTVLSGIEELFGMLTSMNEMTNSVESDVNNAVGVVNKISQNASRSNILALNASIEATHSGEYGRGFAVVASQMGKLANDSGRSATEIKATLHVITEHLSSIISSIKDANGMAKQHMEDIGAIQEVLQETLVLAGKLEENIGKH